MEREQQTNKQKPEKKRKRFQIERNLLVSWCFENSQPQRITSGLKTHKLKLSPKVIERKASARYVLTDNNPEIMQEDKKRTHLLAS